MDKELSPRQLEIIKLLEQGKNRGEVAEELGLSRNTVNVHMQTAFKKLKVRNILEAVKKINK